MHLPVIHRKPCVVCGAYITKPPSCSRRAWPKRKCCSWECTKLYKRGRPNPKTAAALRGRAQPPALIAKRSEGLRRAHAEGRMNRINTAGLRGPATSQWKGDAVGYRAAHNRLVQARGRACDHNCVDCGGDAHEWSYKDADGHSANPDDYSPRCRSCHRRYDKALRQLK